MRCPRCSTESAGDNGFCTSCGTRLASSPADAVTEAGGYPAAFGQSGPQYPPGAAPGGYWPGPGGYPGWPTGQYGAGSSGGAGGQGGAIALRIMALAAAIAGAGLVTWGLFLPVFTYSGPGSRSYSIYSFTQGTSVVGGFWYIAEPVGVAAIALVAAVLVLAGRGWPGTQWLGAGMLTAFGIQTFLFFGGYQFAHSTDVRPGTGGIVGIAGAVIVLAAGLIGGAAAASGRPAGGAQGGSAPSS